MSELVDKTCPECDGTGKIKVYVNTAEEEARMTAYSKTVLGRLDDAWYRPRGGDPALFLLSLEDMAEYRAAIGADGDTPVLYSGVPVEVFDPEREYGPRDRVLAVCPR